MILTPAPGRRFLHPKKTSAVLVGERVRVPSDRILQTYLTPLGRLGMMICLDSYDVSQVASAIVANFVSTNTDWISFMMLPSFGCPPHQLEEVCRDLSYLLANVVVVAASDPRLAQQSVYLCGQELPPINTVNESLKIFRIGREEFLERHQTVRAEFPELIRGIFQSKARPHQFAF